MKRRALLLLAFVLAGVLIRFSMPYKESPDCVYHLRRARFALENFPRTVIIDPLMNFPYGGLCVWPPLFDVTLAIPSLLKRQFSERAAYFVPLVYAAVAIFAAGAAGTAARRKWGLLAALFVAVCPGHIQYSQFGHTDQHVAESCWGFLTLALFLYSCRKPSVRTEAGTGLAFAMALLTWQGAVFWGPLLALPLISEAIFERQNLARAFRILGISTIISAAGTLYWLNGFTVPFTYVSFGWFQPVFVSVCLGLVMLPNIRRAPGPATALALACFAPLAFFYREFAAGTLAGILHLASASSGAESASGAHLSLSKEWLSIILEYKPLLADSWTWALTFLSPAFFLLPAAILLWILRAIAGRNRSLNIALAGTCAFLFFFTLMQRRNVYYAALPAALCSVELSAFLSTRFGRRIVFYVSFAVLVAPMLLGYTKELRGGYEAGKERLEAVSILKKITPQEIDPYDPRFLEPEASLPELKTAGSVLSFWSQGHLVTYYGERPVVANNFGYGFMDSLHFYFADTEEKALSIAKERRIRYVVVMELLPVMNQYAGVLNLPEFIQWNGSKWIPTDRYFRTMQSRLYDFDGKGTRLPDGSTIPALNHFRLLWVSPAGSMRFGHFVSSWKIFEVIS